MNDIDAVLFDLDGTLCRHADDAGAAYRHVLERIGAKPFASTGGTSATRRESVR